MLTFCCSPLLWSLSVKDQELKSTFQVESPGLMSFLKLLIALSLKLSSLGFESGSLWLLSLDLLLVDPAYSAVFDLFIDSSSSRLSTSRLSSGIYLSCALLASSVILLINYQWTIVAAERNTMFGLFSVANSEKRSCGGTGS